MPVPGNQVATEEANSPTIDGSESLSPAFDLYLSGAVQAERPSTVLILEREEINRQLLRYTLKPEGYRIIEAASAAEAFHLLDHEQVDLVIMDLVLPEISGLDFCRELRANRQTRLIPVLILTNVPGADNEIAGIASGANEFLVKPLLPAIVREHIRSMLRNKAAIDSLEEAESVLFALAQAIEQRDKCTSGHCERLAMTSMLLGTALGLSRHQLLTLHRGGFLHDIGKVGIPDAILFKPGPLTREEWAVMKTHTIIGEDICRRTRTLAHVLPIIRHHHERWDGSGYPDGLRGEEIPLLARILQIADIFDALTSTRPYKNALTAQEALDILDAETVKGWRDPVLVGLLHKFIETAPECGNGVLPSTELAPDAVRQSLENMRRALLK